MNPRGLVHSRIPALSTAWKARWPVWLLGVILVSGTIGTGRAASPLVGKPAPTFQIQGVHHERLTLEKFKGHILVVQFGTSW